ncbi:MAG TPA: tubulin-like doman-containing protein [Thermoanaerobaculia bacterium]|nr:tubulin-like doman-containing protein [Thermoanaerobaculia bacterium]
MSEPFQSGQGSIIPALFIGVGGAGSRIVDRLAGRAARLPNWESQLRPLTSFVTIDTNELDQHRLRHVPEGNRLNIAAFDKAKAIEHFRRSQDAQALHWLDRGYQPRPGFKPGAGQIRVESRLGFFYHSLEIRQRLRQLILDSLRPNITWRQAQPPKYNVYLFCTLAGGTGSGSFLSVAYLVDALLREQTWQPRVVANLLLSTLMLDKVGPELHPDIHANTYAALKELEHLTKLDYAQIKREGRTAEEFVFCRDENNPAIPRVTTRPCFLTFLFDRPPHLALPDAEAAIADAAFLQVFTPIMDNLAGELDNYEKTMEDLTHFPGELKNLGQGYTKNFAAFGAAALVLPGLDLLEYSALRFAAQSIRSQITFGVDRSDPTDDRARALARLAVDYADPKFLNMADEGRERAINQAFVHSVQEMARQDAHQELTEGFWHQLVESIETGRPTGVDERGEAIRSESLILQVERKQGEARRNLLNRISIKERAFVFHREGINQYVEHVSRLLEELRAARLIVDEGVRGLETAALEGEVVTELKLDPIAERFLVVRLLERADLTWLPEAQQQLDQAKAKDVGNPKVRERLERELFETLQEAASRHGLWRKEQVFLDARDEAQQYFRDVAAAARKTFDAEIRLRQLRALREYLKRRTRQYARLATRMDALVQDLEREAERLRRGEDALVASLALRVEVFETLDEPRRRLWDRVYRALFLDGGRYISLFDRQVLAETIARELKPVVKSDGTVVEKSVEQTVTDLLRSLLDLGRSRLAPTILGGDGQPGLDLVSGLTLEAQLVLGPGKREGKEVTEDEIDAYRDRKFRDLAQIAGVLARVSTTDAKALDDGVKSNHTRQLVVGGAADGGAHAHRRFLDRLKDVLGAGGRQVKLDTWHDPRLAIVHDVELPIPLYYFEPVVGEIEEAYLQVAAMERRAYNLHTDYRWERSLPNLNPRRSELTVGWSLETLLAGLVTRVITRSAQSWTWHFDGPRREDEDLGHSLSSALYHLGQIHHQDELRELLDQQVRAARRELSEGALRERRGVLLDLVNDLLVEMSRRDRHGEVRRDDLLDRPILRAMKVEISRDAPGEAPSAVGEELFDRLRFGEA